MDLITGNGTVTFNLPTLEQICSTSTSASAAYKALDDAVTHKTRDRAVASGKLKDALDRVRQLERELAEAKADEAKFNAQQDLDVAVQALADMNFDTSRDNDGEEDLIDTAEEMKLFKASKLKKATSAKDEEELMKGMRGMGLKTKRRRGGQSRRTGGIDKTKRHDPKKGAQDIETKAQSLSRAVTVAAAAGLEGMGRRAAEMFIPGVGIVMGKKTAPRLTKWVSKEI